MFRTLKRMKHDQSGRDLFIGGSAKLFRRRESKFGSKKSTRKSGRSHRKSGRKSSRKSDLKMEKRNFSVKNNRGRRQLTRSRSSTALTPKKSYKQLSFNSDEKNSDNDEGQTMIVTRNNF